jgi:hypothetical protein
MPINLLGHRSLVSKRLAAAFRKKEKHDNNDENKNHDRSAFFIHFSLLAKKAPISLHRV